MEFGDRLVIFREKMGLSQQELAEKIGIKPQALARYEKNKSKPSIDLAKKLTNLFNLNTNWLLTGEGEMLKSTKDIQDCSQDKNIIYIDKLSLQAGAGAGIYNYEVETIEKVPISLSLFKTPQNPDHLKIIQVNGDSMEPTLKDGDYVIINTTQISANDGIYALLYDNAVIIKRVQFCLNGNIKIISDNPKYDSFTFKKEELQDLNIKILGKKVMQIS